MKKISDEMQMLEGILDFLAKHFGDEVEVVLHDLSDEKNPHSIVSIRNGHITGREIGGVADKHGMQAVPGEEIGDDIFNEVIYTEKGTILKGSTHKIRGSEGNVIGSICINQDITASLNYENYLRKINGCHTRQNQMQDVNEVLTSVIQEAFISIGKHPSAMNKEDKVSFIKYLDDRGVFLISKSGPHVCETLGISKFTLYNYLEIARGNSDTNE